MKQFNLYLSFLILLLAYSCTGPCIDCSAVILGEVPVPNRYKNFLLFQAIDTIKYENQNGEITKFGVRRDQWSNRSIEVKEIEKGHDCLDDEPCTRYEYWVADGRRQKLRGIPDGTPILIADAEQQGENRDDLTLVIHYSVSWDLEMNGEELSGRTEGSYDYTNDSIPNQGGSNVVEKLGEASANERTYTDVLHIKNGDNFLYVVEGKGIVAFNWHDNIMTLVE